MPSLDVLLARAITLRATWTEAQRVHERHEQRASYASHNFSKSTRAMHTPEQLMRTARTAAGPCPCTDCFHQRIIARSQP